MNEKIYSGAGNIFVMLDSQNPTLDEVVALCRKHSTDGLIVLRRDVDGCDFSMEFYNPDGSSGMMCGNGGRCVVAFARDLGVVKGFSCRFKAPDGMHRGILYGDGNIGITMREASGRVEYEDGVFLNTGAPHFVVKVDDVSNVDVLALGRALRYDDRFAPAGTNVDFVSPGPEGSIRIRTYERGVEGETLACGTGAVACALVSGCSHVITLGGKLGVLSSGVELELTGPAGEISE